MPCATIPASSQTIAVSLFVRQVMTQYRGPVRYNPARVAWLSCAPPGFASILVDANAHSVACSGYYSQTRNLLLRVWDPEQGSIRIDGTDLRELTLDGLRGRIALVAQDTYLFNDTLEKDVRLARLEATAEDVVLALQRAALADFVAGLPEGLATPVGERGVQLSGGQRQRIAIARAFLKDAPILVLDEATSHLDTISEQQIRAALDALMEDRTTIVVAHRLSTIQAADLILVLQAGRVVESGKHADPIARHGIYARLVERQMVGVYARTGQDRPNGITAGGRPAGSARDADDV